MRNAAWRRPPKPILAASFAMVLASAAALIPSPGNHGAVTQVVAGVLVAGFMLALAYGLFRGNSLARWLVIILAVVNAVTGVTRSGVTNLERAYLVCVPLTIIGLLLVPTSSRRWFLDRSGTSTSTPRPPSEV